MIEKIRENDIDVIAKIEKDCFSSPLSPFEIKKVMENPLYHIYINEINNEIVGYIILYIIEDTAEITSVAVKKSKRGQGIGFNMLKEIIMHINANKFLLEVRVSNQQAINLYKKFGFKIIATRKDFYQKPVEDGITMQFIKN